MVLDREEVRLTLPFQEGIEAIAAMVVDYYGKIYDLPVSPVEQMKLAVLEATHNAIRHSESSEKKVYISIQHCQEFIKVLIHDRGKGFNPDLVDNFENPVEDSSIKSGFGMKIIKSMVDEVKIISSTQGTQIILVKKLGRTSHGSI
jgi:anti-sigma regulatory factor (Ser/Thr protein kinase)